MFPSCFLGELLSAKKLKIFMKKPPLTALTIISLLGSYALTVQADEKKDRDGRDEIAIDERFEFLDIDKDDELTLKEFSKGRFLSDEDKKQISKVFAKYDKNSDEALRPREFETGVETHHQRHFLGRHKHVVKGKSSSSKKGKSTGKSSKGGK